ncbi:MAG: hypothetical protein MUE30_04160 [Spirosomaceae bacterium]|nr:hypothetical protein [Spirosomataceae bacterium]
MKKRIVALVALCVGIGSGALHAQDTRTDNHTVTITIPEVALLDLESSGSKNFTLAFVAPTEAGNPVTAPAANTDLWMNYSSIVAASGETARTVSVQITSGTVPAGANLTVQAAPPMGGAGTLGNPLGGPLTLSTTAQDIVTAIGSCYTGNGPTAGHELIYGLAIGTYSSLKHDASGALTVTYTISDI